MPLIELHEDLQRNPELKTSLVTVNSDHIVKIEPRQTFNKDGVPDKDGGASVTLADGKSLNVVESYKRLKKKLKVQKV